MTRRLALLLAVAAALLAGACGGEGADPVERVRAAADKTLAEGSVRVALNLTFSASAVSADVSGEGVVDLDQGRGSFTLDLGSLGMGLGGGVEAVLDRGVIYVKAPAALRASKPWLKVDLSALGAQLGVDIGALGGLQSADLSQALAFLESGASGMAKVGSERVRGADSTHYRGTLDLGRAAAGLPDEARASVDAAVAALGTPTVPADVWLDDEGRLRKVRLAIGSGGRGAPATGVIEFELYDFGVQADIEVPPADQVSDLLATILGSGRPR